MRKLTITRKKSGVAWFGVGHVYIEDANSDDLVINGVTCRKLGKLKNGATLTAEISDEPAKVFVIADKLSKNFCNDYCEIPAGNEDVYLTGKHHYNPATGNPFLFDGQDTAEKKAARKKRTLISILIFIALFVVSFAVSFMIFHRSSSRDKTFTVGEMNITLPGSFVDRTDESGFAGAFSDKDVAIFVLKEGKAELASLGVAGQNLDVKKYLELVRSAGQRNYSAIKTRDGLMYLEHEFTNTDENITFRYYSYAYEAEDAFWIIQFVVDVNKVEQYEDAIAEYAKSVTIKEKRK